MDHEETTNLGGVPAVGRTVWEGEVALEQVPSMTLSAVTLDSPDALVLAAFCRGLLQWNVVEDQPGWVVLRPPGGGTGLSFQSEPAYVPPVWPADPAEPAMRLHLDIEVDDLGAAGAHAESVGWSSVLPVPARIASAVRRRNA